MGEMGCGRKRWVLVYMRISHTLIPLFQFNGENNLFIRLCQTGYLSGEKKENCTLILGHMQNKITQAERRISYLGGNVKASFLIMIGNQNLSIQDSHFCL